MSGRREARVRGAGGLRYLFGGAFRCFWDPLAISRTVQRRAARSCAELAGGRMIDVGAGPQTHRDLFEGRTDRIIAVDFPGPSPTRQIDVWADGHRIPFGDAVADTVSCFTVITYFEDPRRGMAELARVLRPGGRLVLMAQQLRGESHESNDYWRIARIGLRLLATEAGLEDICITPTNGVFGSTGQMLSIWLYESLAERRRLPRALVKLLCAAVLLPHWVLDQLGWGRQHTLFWLLTARRPDNP